MTDLSNYPNGFDTGVLIKEVLGENFIPGKIFWVGNNATRLDSEANAVDNGKGTFLKPFATWDYAIGRCAANRNDVILLRPNHSVTVSAAGDITHDVIGVSVIGLGSGSNKPTVTFDTITSASLLISAANTTIKNVIFLAGIDALANPIHIQASGCTVDATWQDGSSTVEFERAVLTTAAADELNLNIKYEGFTAGNACVNAVRLVGNTNVNVNVDFYGKASTSVVEFLTTACVNVNVTGYQYNSGTTDFSKSVVDTVTGSTWFATFFDGAAAAKASGGSGAAIASDDTGTIAANQTVPSADATANVLERDVVGNKTDAAAAGAVSTVESLMAYAKQNVTANIAIVDQQEKAASGSTAVIVNGDTLFTVAGGPIEILALVSQCVTGNDATASTLQYSNNPTVGDTTAFSGASAALTSMTAGEGVVLNGTALSTAPDLTAGALVALTGVHTRGVIVDAGIITAVVGVGSTTGTWKHYIRYRPLGTGVTVVGT